MLNVESPSSFEDFQRCAQMYYDYASDFVPKSAAVFCKWLQCLRPAGGVSVCRYKGEIIAFIAYGKRQLEFHNTFVVQQLFFCSDTGPIMAVRATRLLHAEMVTWGRRNRCSLALSAGSHEAESDVFLRILEKDGWQRKGYLCKLLIAENKASYME